MGTGAMLISSSGNRLCMSSESICVFNYGTVPRSVLGHTVLGHTARRYAGARVIMRQFLVGLAFGRIVMASSHLPGGQWAKEMVTQEVTIFSATWSLWAGIALHCSASNRSAALHAVRTMGACEMAGAGAGVVDNAMASGCHNSVTQGLYSL